MGSHCYVVGGETICFTRRDVVAGLSKYSMIIKNVTGARGIGPVDKVTSPGGRFMKIYSREQENKKKVRRHIS